MITHLLKPGRFYLKRLGQKAFIKGGVAGSPYCVYQNVPGHALGWDNMTSGDTTVGCDLARIEKESCIERRGCRTLTSSNLFSLELKFRGKHWLMLKGKPPHGKARVNFCATSDQIYNPGNYSL